MSAKNQLQEYFQKKDIPLPQYESIRVGGADHEPGWMSSVVFPDGSRFDGTVHPTKSSAQCSAAEKALARLNSITIEKSIDRRTVDPRTVLLVDVENLPGFIGEVLAEVEGLDIFAFVGEHHCLSSREYPSGVTVIHSPSTRSDGTDTCIQVYIGCLLSMNRYDTYLIATRDHYGSALVDIISSTTLPWVGKLARVVTKVSHI